MKKKYSVEITSHAKRQLKKLEDDVKKNIVGWIEENLNNCENPFAYSDKLEGANDKNVIRYKGNGLDRNYRIIAKVNKNKVIILVLDIGKRDHIYD